MLFLIMFGGTIFDLPFTKATPLFVTEMDWKAFSLTELTVGPTNKAVLYTMVF